MLERRLVRSRDPDLRSRESHKDLAVRCSITLRIRLSECLGRGRLRCAAGTRVPG
jgi:hypothetical protein